MSAGVGLLTVLLAAASTLTPMGTADARASDDPLAAHRWRSRVLVVSAPSPGDERLAAQRTILEREHSGRRERDLVTVEAVGSGTEALALRRRLGLSSDRFAAVLIGKDGGAKLTADEPIPAARLFRTIDAMPMRKDEMRR